MRREFINVKKLVCILMLIALVMAPTAFAKGCKHENTELRNAATGDCYQAGYSGDLCCVDCGAVLIPGIHTDNGVHVLDAEPDGYREATCTEHGFSGNYYCTECGGLIIHGKIIPKTEHIVVVSEAEEPDCRNEGRAAYTYCYNCRNDLEERKAIPALGHEFSEIYESVEPTCRTEGFISGYCTRCEYDRDQDLAMLEHDFVDNVCTGCGYRVPGLYDNDGNLVKTWEQVCSDGDVYAKKYRDYGGYRTEYESVYLGMTGVLVLPDDADVPADMFQGCQLTGLWFGKETYHIYDLTECPNLESVRLYGRGEIELDDDSLVNNPNLKEVIVGEGCDIGIGMDAFAGCPNMEKLVMPTDLSDCWIASAFVPGDNLTVYYPGTEEAWIERFGEDLGLNVVFNYTGA